MKLIILHWVPCGAAILVLSACPKAQAAEDVARQNLFVDDYVQLSERMTSFLASNKDTIIAIPEPTSHDATRKVVRAIKTALWLQLLDQIDKVRDAKFDFEARPTLNVKPPGFRYDAGVAPKAIVEPEIRREYEEAINQNKQKAARYHLQSRLKSLDDQYSELAVNYITAAYDKTPEDLSQLMDQVNSQLSNDAQRAKMKKSLKDLLGSSQKTGK